MNLLTDSILTVTDGRKLSLPQLFAEMERGTVTGFSSLRAHQRPAWHMFLVQLAALALWRARRQDIPGCPDEWTEILRGLTPDHPDDAPWTLVVADRRRPAFMQPPAPAGLKWSPIATADDLDMLITARNHDIKQSIAWNAAPEDWVYALVSLQTCEGYGGKGNHGIARMNGGFSSRVMLGLVPAQGAGEGNIVIDPSSWWARDVRCLLDARAEEGSSRHGTVGGAALLWCIDWPEGEQLELPALDPWFIEVCRRVRVVDGERMSAEKAMSRASRIYAKTANGVTGDPWAPVSAENKTLTLGTTQLDFRRLCSLLFSDNWTPPLLARPRSDEKGDMILVFEAFARSNVKTDGFQARAIRVPGAVVERLADPEIGAMVEELTKEIKAFDDALKTAIALLAAGGDFDRLNRTHFQKAAPARKRVRERADALFFPALWRRFTARDSDPETREAARTAFLADLWNAVDAHYAAAESSVPCSSVLRPRAEIRARRALETRVDRAFPGLIEQGEPQ